MHPSCIGTGHEGPGRTGDLQDQSGDHPLFHRRHLCNEWSGGSPLIVGIYVGPNDSSRSGWQHIRVDAQDAYWTRQPGGHVLYMIAQTPTWFVSVQITEPEATEATAEEAMTTLLRHLTS